MGEGRNGKPKPPNRALPGALLSQPRPRCDVRRGCHPRPESAIAAAGTDRHEMSESLPRHPLHRFPFVDTRDPNEVRHLLREYPSASELPALTWCGRCFR